MFGADENFGVKNWHSGNPKGSQTKRSTSDYHYSDTWKSCSNFLLKS
jgi:hypothetical protein